VPALRPPLGSKKTLAASTPCNALSGLSPSIVLAWPLLRNYCVRMDILVKGSLRASISPSYRVARLQNSRWARRLKWAFRTGKLSNRVVIIHRNRLFRESIANVLSSTQQFDAVGVDHVHSGWPGLLQDHAPHLVLIDSQLRHPRAAAMAAHVRESVGHAKLIVFGSASGREDLFECVQAGIDGCVLEESSLKELQEAIDRVLRGEMFCSRELVFQIFRRFSSTSCASCRHKVLESVELSPRELEVVRLIGAGLSNKQIAGRLSLSLYTVKNHVHNLIGKLDVENRREAVASVRRRLPLAR
jgi:DNA-binding NarL/FixJ family response regulator